MESTSDLHDGHIVVRPPVVKLIVELSRSSIPVRREISGVALNRSYCLGRPMDDLLADSIVRRADISSVTGEGFPTS